MSSSADTITVRRSERIENIICFSHLRWRFVFQRPQHLLTRAARGCQVWFVEEPVWDEGEARIESYEPCDGLTVLTPTLPPGASEEDALRLQRSLVRELAGKTAGTRRVAWYYTPMALRFSRGLDADLTIYDNMDELSAFRGASPMLLDLEEELFRRADLVFTGGQSLYLAKRHRHPDVRAFPSSIDVAHFAPARVGELLEPVDLAGIGAPRLGFFGVIDERLDIDLVAAIADARPDWQLVMIGPVVKIDPASLPQRANIHWLGGKDYRELPRYLAHWDIGIMPFAINEATRFISPTKTPEFLAAGLPVISTPITDVISPYGESGLVEIADEAPGFVESAERLLAYGRSAGWLAKVDRHLAQSSWDLTWSGMERAMLRALAKGKVERPLRRAVARVGGEARV